MGRAYGIVLNGSPAIPNPSLPPPPLGLCLPPPPSWLILNFLGARKIGREMVISMENANEQTPSSKALECKSILGDSRAGAWTFLRHVNTFEDRLFVRKFEFPKRICLSAVDGESNIGKGR